MNNKGEVVDMLNNALAPIAMAQNGMKLLCVHKHDGKRCLKPADKVVIPFFAPICNECAKKSDDRIIMIQAAPTHMLHTMITENLVHQALEKLNG